MGSTQSLPEDYSLDEVRRIMEAYEEDQEVQRNEEEDGILGTDENSSVMEFPNIVVIMNEAFSDLRVLGDFETTEPVLEYWDSIQENMICCWANVSVLGGKHGKLRIRVSHLRFHGGHRAPQCPINLIYPAAGTALRYTGPWGLVESCFWMM